jgi:TPR repeat protein
MASRRDIERRLARLERAGEVGDGDAFWELGCLLEEGIADGRGRQVIRADARKAVAAYRRAAELGDASGLGALGLCYCRGRGVRADQERALECFTKAWRTDGAGGWANNIATVHRDWGDMRRAFAWWRRAADARDDEAWVTVGYCYYYGIGVRRNRAAAVASFRRARKGIFISDCGREEALYHLAVAYLDRTGSRSRSQARTLLAKANVDDDYPEARDLLAQLDAGAALRPCRCRRGWYKTILGQAACEVHGRPATMPRRTRMPAALACGTREPEGHAWGNQQP